MIDDEIKCDTLAVGYRQSRKVFSDDMENKLVDYIMRASDIYQGLSTKEIRKL